MYGLVAGPHDLCQIDQAFMAAAPAAYFEQLAAASNRIGDSGRRLGRPADELPHAPFMAGKRVRRAVGFLDLGRAARDAPVRLDAARAHSADDRGPTAEAG